MGKLAVNCQIKNYILNYKNMPQNYKICHNVIKC